MSFVEMKVIYLPESEIKTLAFNKYIINMKHLINLLDGSNRKSYKLLKNLSGYSLGLQNLLNFA